MQTVTDILEFCRSQIGVAEDPLGSNNVVYNTDYYGKPVSGDKYPWCCVFLWDVFRLCGASGLFYGGKKTASCITLLEWATKQKLTVPVNDVKPGDIVFFDWNSNGVPDHVGICETASGLDTITTIEGNLGDAVRRRTRNRIGICGVFRPLYQTEDGRYQTIDQLPRWYQDAIRDYIKEEALAGDNKGLDLSDDMARTLTIVWRYINNAKCK